MIENDKLRILIESRRGARIDSFVDKEKNKDWVWRPQKVPDSAKESLDFQAGFDENWAGGWEEVFPNDAPVEVEGFTLADHGELWRREWRMVERDSKFCAKFELNCEFYPCFVVKEFVLDQKDPRLEIVYRITSKAEKELPYIFKFHPALAIEEGDTFKMPHAMMSPIELGFSRILGRDQLTRFPHGSDREGKQISIDKVLPDDQFKREFVKISSFKEGQCALFNQRTQRELRFDFSREMLPYIWLFQSYGGFEGHYVAMIEPTNAGHYDLKKAAKEDKCSFLKPRETAEFKIQISLL